MKLSADYLVSSCARILIDKVIIVHLVINFTYLKNTKDQYPSQNSTYLTYVP